MSLDEKIEDGGMNARTVQEMVEAENQLVDYRWYFNLIVMKETGELNWMLHSRVHKLVQDAHTMLDCEKRLVERYKDDPLFQHFFVDNDPHDVIMELYGALETILWALGFEWGVLDV